ncbi:hypothetical protein GTP23_08170 [Pseudoduganella sp. FT93W]|uniref:Phytanoyl-CoA dioxygenase n=1 Tax=Duganella fentianensis TaxID=2692177 RepID=A0A845HW01_9BURK|nr:hypothetical protein [Duganella fentianensis]MYN45042.1 hypothetical protein [Duganella fentianensis]
MSALPAPALPSAAPTAPLTVAKLRHDADQFDYLNMRGLLDPAYSDMAACYRQLAAQLVAEGVSKRPQWNSAELQAIGSIYNRMLYRRPAAVVPEPLGQWVGSQVEQAYLAQQPNVVIIDDFLSAPALASLRSYCLESMVWNSLRYSHGRLGALYHRGLRCPLLDQLATALRATLPAIIRPRYRLNQLWAYKYPADMPGDDVHADFAAVNVNFWITPDQANLDPASGGMYIYDVAAPADWQFEEYNRHPERIRRYLSASGAQARYIPYRQNRAIIFDSDLFHGTARCHFRDDYESRRINVTLLYGQRHQDDSQPAQSWPQHESGWRSAALRRQRRG